MNPPPHVLEAALRSHDRQLRELRARLDVLEKAAAPPAPPPEAAPAPLRVRWVFRQHGEWVLISTTTFAAMYLLRQLDGEAFNVYPAGYASGGATVSTDGDLTLACGFVEAMLRAAHTGRVVEVVP